MCSDSASKLGRFNLKMGAGLVEDKDWSNLLEFAANDDLTSFKHVVEERGSDVNEVSLWYGRSFGSKKMMLEERTPIMIAALYGSTEVLNYIIQTRKVDVNRACGSNGDTPLHCAAAGGSRSSVEIVRLLIEASADINAVDVNGNKPRDLIPPCVKSYTNRRKTLEMLLNGISVDTSSNDDEEERGTILSEKKEYPIDISLPDINNGIYGSDEFRMYSFKVKPCSRAYSHDWTECPFVHPGENARRRDPSKYSYTCVPCPEFKKGSCAKGDNCEFAHGVFESWLHPAQYRTRLCKDETGCSRKVCFFAHKPEDLRPLYASTGSAMPSPRSISVSSLDLTSNLSPLSIGPSSMMSPSITCSSPMSAGNMWQNKPTLQFQGSRLKTAYSGRDVDLVDLQNFRTQQMQQQQLVEEMANLSSPYNRFGDLKPTNLDESFDLLSQFQGRSPKYNTTTGSHLQSPNGHQNRPNMNQLRASYPSNISSSPSRNPSAYNFDSSPGVAAAVMNSRSSAFSNRSQSFIDRSGALYGLPGSANSASLGQSKLSDWGSLDGQVNWGFNGDDRNKLRKSASFGYRSGNGSPSASAIPMPSSTMNERDARWVNSLVNDVPTSGETGLYGGEQRQGSVHDQWLEQMYIDQEQKVAKAAA